MHFYWLNWKSDYIKLFYLTYIAIEFNSPLLHQSTLHYITEVQLISQLSTSNA